MAVLSHEDSYTRSSLLGVFIRGFCLKLLPLGGFGTGACPAPCPGGGRAFPALCPRGEGTVPAPLCRGQEMGSGVRPALSPLHPPRQHFLAEIKTGFAHDSSNPPHTVGLPVLHPSFILFLSRLTRVVSMFY